MDRRRNGSKEANALGAWVFPGLVANTLEEEASKKKKTNKRRIDSEDDGGNAQNT